MQRQHSPAFKAEILAEVAKGASVRDLAKQHKLRNSLIYQWRKKQGQGSLTAAPKGKVSPSQKAIAVAELAAGGSAKQIGQRLGVSDASVYNWRRAAQSNGHGPLIELPKDTFKADRKDSYTELRDAASQATGLLRQAEAYVMGRMAQGKFKQDKAHLLMQLALGVLQGD